MARRNRFEKIPVPVRRELPEQGAQRHVRVHSNLLIGRKGAAERMQLNEVVGNRIQFLDRSGQELVGPAEAGTESSRYLARCLRILAILRLRLDPTRVLQVAASLIQGRV